MTRTQTNTEKFFLFILMSVMAVGALRPENVMLGKSTFSEKIFWISMGIFCTAMIVGIVVCHCFNHRTQTDHPQRLQPANVALNR